MPYQIDIPIHFFRLKFHEGGGIVVPLRDQQAFHFTNAIAPVANRYSVALQNYINKGGQLESILSEYVPGPLYQDTIAIGFEASSDGVSYPAFELEFDIYFNKGQKIIGD